MPNLFSRVFDRIWCRAEMDALHARRPIRALSDDHARAQRLSGFARAVSETYFDTEDARVARTLYEMAISEAVRSNGAAVPASFPSRERLAEATSAPERRDVLARCDSAYEEARGALVAALAPYRFLLMRRRVQVAAIVALVVGLAWGARAVVRPDLAAGKPWRTSSSWGGFPRMGTSFRREDIPRGKEAGVNNLIICTDEQNNPWLEVDLGKPTAIRSIQVVNRQDCCDDRAIPMVFEVSTDQRAWTPVARREEGFIEWNLSFPKQTVRWVRLRVNAKQYLHIEEFHVY
jgi:hypothetical protein